MDGWTATTNWLIFAVAVGGLVWYYLPKSTKVEKIQEKIKAKEQPTAVKQPKQHHAKRNDKPEARVAFATGTTPKSDVGADAKEENPLQFAEGMMKARKGTALKSSDKADTRIKTVKQGDALRTSSTTAAHSKDISDDAPIADIGGVADMLDPVALGPSSLRITPSQQPSKEKTPKQAKNEVVETKKQRQNRQKTEAKKQQRDEEEKERKALEEKQRRSAREARGEPAKNGIPLSSPPASNAWSSANGSAKPITEIIAGSNGPLLDTFDAQSTGSSNAATEGHQSQWVGNLPTEEEQIAAFKEQDNDWNEVKSSKKQKKKAVLDSNGVSTPTVAPVTVNKVAAPTSKPLTNGKPVGFQALKDELDQSTGADPNDPESWGA